MVVLKMIKLINIKLYVVDVKILIIWMNIHNVYHVHLEMLEYWDVLMIHQLKKLHQHNVKINIS